MMKGTSATPMGSVLFSARTTHSRVSSICLVGSNVGVADSRRRIFLQYAEHGEAVNE